MILNEYAFFLRRKGRWLTIATRPLTGRTYNPDLWLVSPKYDLLLIIFSSSLLIIPHFFSAIGGMTNIVVDLLVTALIGGPHLFATYTMTFMEPRFRERYKRYTWGALLMPVIVVTLAIVNLTLLVTIFFFWASVHVIHQALYIADSYRNKDPRWKSHQQVLSGHRHHAHNGMIRPADDSWKNINIAKWRRYSQVIDYGLLMTSLYPIATFKFTGTPLWFGNTNLSEHGFETGGRALLFPEFLKQDWMAYLATAAFFTLLILFIWKTVWEYRNGLFHGPKTLHMSLAAVLFFITPIMNNLDVAFQGLNVWHSFQYLAVVLYLNRLRAERGLIGSQFVANLSKRGSSLYWLCFAFTVGAAFVYLLVRFIVTATGVWADDPMQIHYFSFYSVILSALLVHYYFDHFLFLQVDDVITPKWNH
jgi:hypothetical protein